MAVKKSQKQRVSLSSDQMVQGGLPDDFDGVITKAVFAPTNYDGKMDHYVLAALITYKPDPETGMDEFTQIYSVGDLQFFAPSKDGEEPVDLENGEGEDLEGYFVVPVGERKQLANSSNFAVYVKHLEACEFTGLSETSSLESLEGIYGHFNQIELPKRSGIIVQDDSKRKGPKTLLCMTELKEAPKATKGAKSTAKATSTKAKGKPAPEPEEEEEESGEETMESRVGEVIVAALAEADDNELPKSKLVSLVVKGFKDAKEKAAAVKVVSDDKYLLSGDYGFSFDKKSGTISLG